MQRTFKCTFMVTFLSVFLSISSFAAGRTGWSENEYGKRYVVNDYLVMNTIKNIDGIDYYFNGSGYVVEDPSKRYEGVQFEEGSFPLEHLRDEFVVDSKNRLTTKGDMEYLWEIYPGCDNRMINWKDKVKKPIPEDLVNGRSIRYEDTEAGEYVMQRWLDESNPVRFTMPAGGGASMLAIAKLAGVKFTGYQQMENDEYVLALADEINKFLNSFDWKNASDLEKAIAVCNRIQRADYHTEGAAIQKEDYFAARDIDMHSSYSCLVLNKTVCDGYTSAANLLSNCIGLTSSSGGGFEVGHEYPLFYVNGVWLRNEPTSKDKVLAIHDWINDVIATETNVLVNRWDEYFMRSGYEIPWDLRTAFPDVPPNRMGFFAWNRLQNDLASNQGIQFQ